MLSRYDVPFHEIRQDASRHRDLVKVYRAEAQHQLLSHEEEIALGVRIQQGDTKARNELVNHNLRLVVSIASKFNRSQVTFADIIQEGNIGLIKAAEKFDPSRRCRFSTYATFWIRRYVLRHILEHPHVRIPEGVRQEYFRVTRAEYRYLLAHGREPRDDELAQLLGLSIERVQESRNGNPFTIALDASPQTEKGDGRSLHEDLLDENATEPDPYGERDRSRVVTHLLEALRNEPQISEKKREQMSKVVESIYGLNGQPSRKLQQVARELNISVAKAQELLNGALRLMRRHAVTEQIDTVR